jgi:hypothetical protein
VRRIRGRRLLYGDGGAMALPGRKITAARRKAIPTITYLLISFAFIVLTPSSF